MPSFKVQGGRGELPHVAYGLLGVGAGGGGRTETDCALYRHDPIGSHAIDETLPLCFKVQQPTKVPPGWNQASGQQPSNWRAGRGFLSCNFLTCPQGDRPRGSWTPRRLLE